MTLDGERSVEESVELVVDWVVVEAGETVDWSKRASVVIEESEEGDEAEEDMTIQSRNDFIMIL